MQFSGILFVGGITSVLGGIPIPQDNCEWREESWGRGARARGAEPAGYGARGATAGAGEAGRARSGARGGGWGVPPFVLNMSFAGKPTLF